jgi:glycosyltransferase involved in cell wall biosynthesis
LQDIYQCLQNQLALTWEWVVVDDFSDDATRQALQLWHKELKTDKVHLICNPTKSNAAVCRNIGANESRYDYLVFLDSDDVISNDFVLNRQVDFKDFIVFKNTAVINEHDEIINKIPSDRDCLNHFLAAQFIWPVTAILWEKSFFQAIGGFNPKLRRLQDVELAIRGMQKSSSFKIYNNSVDFFYNVKPISERSNFVQPVCEAVKILISEILEYEMLTKYQRTLIKGYYYTCVRYFERVGDKEDVEILEHNLKLFYRYDYISILNYVIGFCLIRFFKFGWLSGYQFLRFNRFLFKPKLFEN